VAKGAGRPEKVYGAVKLNIAIINFRLTLIPSKIINMEKTELSAAKKLSKKQARKIAYEKISHALAEYRNSIKEKKFKEHLKKASKLFASDIAKAAKKKPAKAKKAKKISIKKNPANQEEQGLVM
jgi:predicted ArsR family transcriptional regulator